MSQIQTNRVRQSPPATFVIPPFNAGLFLRFNDISCAEELYYILDEAAKMENLPPRIIALRNRLNEILPFRPPQSSSRKQSRSMHVNASNPVQFSGPPFVAGIFLDFNDVNCAEDLLNFLDSLEHKIQLSNRVIAIKNRLNQMLSISDYDYDDYTSSEEDIR